MKRKYFLILATAVLLIGPLSGCGKEANETDETVTQESLYEEESKESEKNDAAQDDTAGEVPDWLGAYVDYIEGMEDYDSHDSGSFIYVDEDDIPEFVMYTGSAYIVLTFQDGDVDELQTGQLRFRYIEGKNLICDASGRAGEYAHHVYSIENGKWTCVAEGKFISEFRDGLQFNRYFFEWEGEKVEEELYWDRLHQVFDEEQAIVPKDYRMCDDMLSHMKAGDFVWETEDEQHTEKDRGQVIADFEYSDENIPISKVDFASYKNEMSEEDWQALSSFFPILLEGKTFDVQVYDWKRRADVFEEHSINDLYAGWADMFLEYPDKFVLDKFTLCDITGDGQKELVLYSGFHYAVGMYCIFHREGDHFYAICENIRSFEDLQVNGLYYGSEGASSGSYWRLHFLRDVFWEEEIAKYNAARDYYKIGGEEVSEAEMEAWKDEVKVGRAVWYEARAFQCDPDVPEVYRNVLWQYVQVIRADIDWDTLYERQMNGEWQNVYWEFFPGRSGEHEIYYCLKDLTDDGFPELIMSCDDPMYIDFIYYYNQEKGIQNTHMSGYWDLTLYEGGVVKREHGILYIIYEQFQPDTEEWELVVRSEYSWDEDASRYYRSWDDSMEIEEEEYQRIIDELTREPIEPIELEWTLLDVWQ